MSIDLEPLVGEPIALDFVNTRVNSRSGTGDQIATPRGLRAWLALEADRLGELTPTEADRLGGSDLAEVHTTRDHVTAVLQAARTSTEPAIAALEHLNGLMHRAPRVERMEWTGGAVVTVRRRHGSLVERLCATLAAATAGMIADGSIARVRECEEPRCILLFLPRNPRRRWCNPAICGNRARVKSYYHRHKPTTAVRP